MNTDRIIDFGKYKGTPVKQLILEHIGYIYWCLSNLKGFKLNNDEQVLYDALAIANIKYKINLVFPVDCLSEYISNKKALEKGITPFFIYKNGIIGYHILDKDNPIIRSVLKYKNNNIHSVCITTSNMANMTKYLFEPIYDEPLDDYFIGTNPHNILEL